ncbi:MAG TPA: hypothetical protein VM052_03615, partial [Candidatus Limnocylindrales bacterium]|nr:hypothetical protein [Candidatus Limnocylindrales bacterium]
MAELRATSALIGRLPDLVPSRRLVPRLAGPPMWLAPLRTLTTFASGVSVFLFIASALLGNLNTLATTTGAAGNAPAASALSASAPERNAATGPVPAPGGLTQSSPSAADQAKVAGAPSAAPKPSSAFSDTSAPPQDAARADQVGPHADENAARARTIDAPALSNPWLWL